MAKDAARSFSATIEKGDRGGAFVTIPFDVEKELGAKRVRVVATIDDVEYRGSLVRMGSSDWILGVLKEIRERIGKAPGDTVAITVRKDTDPRMVDTPADLRKALENAGVLERFEAMSYTHRREYVGWIDGAKKIETRERRVAKAIEMIREGKSR